MKFALIDLTGGATTADGGALTSQLLARFAQAYTVQLNVDYASEWGGDFQVRAASGLADLQPNEMPFIWLPSSDAAPGAIAWHTLNGNGMPALFDVIGNNDTLVGPGNSACVAGSHELLETPADPATNLWADADAPIATQYAREICDPFENQSYPWQELYLSNFALPAWFWPGAPGPYSFLAKMGMGGVLDAPGPMQIPLGQGYAITRQYDPTSEQQLWGYVLHGECRRRPDLTPHSRRWRRGVRI